MQRTFGWKNRRLRLYRNIREFQLDTSGSQTLVICFSKNAFVMQVRQLNCSEDICFSCVKDILIDLVNSIKQRYGINITYRINFKCSEGIYKSGRISLETVMETSEYRCKEHHNTMHSSKEVYSSWLTVYAATAKICPCTSAMVALKFCVKTVPENTRTRTEKRRIDLSFRPKDMCYDVDSQRIYCIDSNNSALNCIDRDGTIIFTFADPHWIKLKCLTIDTEGNVLVLRVNTQRDCNLGCVI
ncbi:unnamed protein product [Mytilus coruscus]|uniref:Uncharacterized protein n=1 Tax=Mytilus coruscus TaxID=42192 RepID=A0A6J8EER8_MYTCO|nr:unnamed protein product [Mytilus coruscus]